MAISADSYVLAANVLFYVHTPALLIDAAGRVAAINAACRTLLGPDVAGCKGRPVSSLQHCLLPRLAGDLLAPDGPTLRHFNGAESGPVDLAVDDLCVVGAPCRYQSERFGDSTLRPMEMPVIDTASGHCTGVILNLAITALADRAGFDAALDKRWQHELMWEVYATSYDAVQLELQFYREVMQRHLAALAPVTAGHVLDIGAGTGNITLSLLRQGTRVTAIDVSRAMLVKLHSKLEPGLARALTVIEDTAEQLPQCEDASVDGVTSMQALFDMDDPFAALDEAVRVLKPGGPIVLTDPKTCFNIADLMAEGERALRDRGVFDALAIHWVRIQSVAPLVNENVVGDKTVRAAGNRPRRWSAETALEQLRRHGFTDLVMEDSHHGNCATITGRKPAKGVA